VTEQEWLACTTLDALNPEGFVGHDDHPHGLWGISDRRWWLILAATLPVLTKQGPCTKCWPGLAIFEQLADAEPPSQFEAALTEHIRAHSKDPGGVPSCPIRTTLYYCRHYLRGNVTRRECWDNSYDAIFFGRGECLRLAREARPDLSPEGVRELREQHKAAASLDAANALALLRDVLGNPFRPLPYLAPSLLDWNGGLVRKLAQAAYDHRDLPSGHLEPSRLAVLADALEEAGVSEGGLLDHLRGAGPHVRGCHVLDILLGRE
jgi:hypothetical protein